MAAAGTAQQSDRRAQILDGVCRVIVRDGVDGVRSQSVAREARVSPALPHYYWPTLDDLVVAAFGRTAEREAEREAERTAPADAVAALGALLAGPLEGPAAEVRERWILRTEFQRRALFDRAVAALERERAAADLARVAEAVAAAELAGAVPEHAAPAALAMRLVALRDGLGGMVLLGLLDQGAAQAHLAVTVAGCGAWPSTAAAAAHRPRRGPHDRAAAGASDTRTQILDAAVGLIAAAGVAGVHFPAVAERAGVSTSLPRYYFPTIRALVAGAFDRNAELTLARVEGRAAAAADPLERLRDAYAYEVALDAELVRPTWVLWSELQRLATLHAERRDQAVDRLRGWMAYDGALVGELQSAGRVARGLDVPAATERLVATLNGAGMLWMLGVIDPAAFADLLNHAIDDELGLA
ncbi:MAG: TetR family transcriptional regulator [Actinomycetota bacterium]